MAVGIQPGDEVIVPSFTFAATANAVRLAGATPVFVDIDPQTFCIGPRNVRGAISDRTRAVVPVHLYGHPADLPKLTEIAAARGIHIVEDAAQAHGASISGIPCGAWGSAGAFSFYPTKNMTTGEGGMVTTESAVVDHQVRLLRNQGMERRYENEVVGFNMRMTDIYAAIGRVQLTRLRAWTGERQANAAYLTQHLSGVVTPHVAPGAVHVFHQYTVRVRDDRDGFAKALADEHAVGTGVYYPVPTHRLPSFAEMLDLPETERAAAEVLSLPVYPGLSRDELDRIVAAVNAVARAGA
jgi:dTDP-4-amino-4,6-dideoxygalactose transaminase